ncbi:MAG: hypothetical protein LBN43_02640 [Oscillospiraceae bacterium]|jgi:hypothetical protein|nr:hypothetical protein [Oscillospiraceae bacterium]
MKKSVSFIAGFALGALIFGGTAAFAVVGITANISTQKIYVNGAESPMTAYSIGDNNYVRLRDVGKAVDFGVTYDSVTNSVIIDTTTPYVDELPSLDTGATPAFPYKLGDTPTKADSQSDWTFALPDNDFNRQFSFLNSLWVGGCNWYTEGRFHEVTGVYWEDCLGDDVGNHGSTKDYLYLTQKHPEQLDAITDMNDIRSQSIALYYYPELGHGHQVFVEFVERDVNGKPVNVYYTQANGYLSANNQFDEGIDGIVQVKTFDEFIIDCIGFIALKANA